MVDSNLAHLSNSALKAMMKKYSRWNKKHVAIENDFKRMKYWFARRELEKRRKTKFGV